MAQHGTRRRKGYIDIGLISAVLLFLIPGGKAAVTVPAALEEFAEGGRMEELEGVFREQSLALDELVKNAPRPTESPEVTDSH